MVDEDDPRKGLLYDGRLAEDFKLSTGTWVRVGPLRARLLAAAAGYAQDVVIAGHDHPYPTALIVPNLAACREQAGAAPEASAAEVLAHPRVVDTITRAIDELARDGTGSSTFVASGFSRTVITLIAKHRFDPPGRPPLRRWAATRARNTDRRFHPDTGGPAA